MYMDGAVTSETKAHRLRAAFEQGRHVLGLSRSLPPSLPLMDAFGTLGMAICVLDANDFELVFPHSLFQPSTLDAKVLFTFHESTVIPSCVGAVDGLDLSSRQLRDLDLLSGELKKHIQTQECSDLIDRIRSALATDAVILNFDQ